MCGNLIEIRKLFPVFLKMLMSLKNLPHSSLDVILIQIDRHFGGGLCCSGTSLEIPSRSGAFGLCRTRFSWHSKFADLYVTVSMDVRVDAAILEMSLQSSSANPMREVGELVLMMTSPVYLPTDCYRVERIELERGWT